MQPSRVSQAGRRHTPKRSIRVPDHLWRRALARADKTGDTLSEVIRRYLERYADQP